MNDMRDKTVKEKTLPILAVGMPVYNGGAWIEETIESILSQSFTDFELFIADNASTDNTEEICRRYAEQDARVRYHRHAQNRGAHKNYNDVCMLTKSKYFKWSSCSDICKPMFFEKCIDILEAREDVVLAYPLTMLFSSDSGEESLFYQNLNLEDDLASDRIRTAYDWTEGLNNAFNGVFRRAPLDKMMPYREIRGFDINLMAEMSLYGKFIEIDEPLYYRRFDTGSTGIMLGNAERISFFGASKAEFGYLQQMAREVDRFVMPFRTPLPFIEKWRIECDLLSRLLWRGPDFMRKLLTIPRRVLNRLRHI